MKSAMPWNNDTAGSMRQMSTLQRFFHIDGTLLTGLLLLALCGLVVLYSAFDGGFEEVQKQAVRLTVAFGAMVVIAQIPPSSLRRWSPWAYGLGVLMLVAVLLVGDIGKGAQRWLDLGVIRFQPSELMKLALPMMVAWYFSERPLPPRWTHVVICGVIIVAPVALITLQPDLGTSILIGAAGFFVLYMAGLRWRYIFGAIIAAIPVGAAMWFFGMHDYQRQRVLTFLNPESDPLGAVYHIIQSKIALGSGGLFGKGWLNGTQSHLQFLPERHTDFVFAVLGEEFGLMGALQILALYLFVIGRGLYIAVNAQDTYSRLLAGSISLTFFVYV